MKIANRAVWCEETAGPSVSLGAQPRAGHGNPGGYVGGTDYIERLYVQGWEDGTGVIATSTKGSGVNY